MELKTRTEQSIIVVTATNTAVVFSYVNCSHGAKEIQYYDMIFREKKKGCCLLFLIYPCVFLWQA